MAALTASIGGRVWQSRGEDGTGAIYQRSKKNAEFVKLAKMVILRGLIVNHPHGFLTEVPSAFR